MAAGSTQLVAAAFQHDPALRALAGMCRIPPEGDAPILFPMGNPDPPAETVRRYGATESGYVDAPLRAVAVAPFHMLARPVSRALVCRFRPGP